MVGLANTLVGAFIGVYGFIFLLQRTGHMVRNRGYLVGISDLIFLCFHRLTDIFIQPHLFLPNLQKTAVSVFLILVIYGFYNSQRYLNYAVLHLIYGFLNTHKVI